MNKQQKIKDRICEMLNITHEEEDFRAVYNPMRFYCELKDLGFKDDESKLFIENYGNLYNQIIKIYERRNKWKRKL